jgi:hypothetical protein
MPFDGRRRAHSTQNHERRTTAGNADQPARNDASVLGDGRPAGHGQLCPSEFDPFEIDIEPAVATALQRDLRKQLLPILAATPEP